MATEEKNEKRNKNKLTGAFGEDIIVNFLTNRGYEIIEKNWRIREGEIDIVALAPNGIFTFVEVKTRRSLAFGHPLEAINNEKAHRLQRLALAWLVTSRTNKFANE
jgi:putative endonuclease